jgi:hypothetical protein
LKEPLPRIGGGFCFSITFHQMHLLKIWENIMTKEDSVINKMIDRKILHDKNHEFPHKTCDFLAF